MAQSQNLPFKREEESKWTRRALLPFVAASNAVIKTFKNPYDMTLGFCVLVLAISIFIGREASWMFYFFCGLVLLCSVYERHPVFDTPVVGNKETKVSSTK